MGTPYWVLLWTSPILAPTVWSIVRDSYWLLCPVVATTHNKEKGIETQNEINKEKEKENRIRSSLLFITLTSLSGVQYEVHI